MSEDAQLDEFAASTPEPPEATYAFDPDGAPCAECGNRVTRRFRSADGLVCADCKPWRV